MMFGWGKEVFMHAIINGGEEFAFLDGYRWHFHDRNRNIEI
jgi:hypothetical protein